MQRIDAGYLYDLGSAIQCLRTFRFKTVPAYEIWQPLQNCREKVAQFMLGSVYSPSLRAAVHTPAEAFIGAIDDLMKRIINEPLDKVSSADQASLQQAWERYEPVLSSELSSQVTYLVTPKGVYDIIALVDRGGELFPPALYRKAPETLRDVEEGGKALAFELWSSAAFHFHRANESVLRRYYDQCYGPGKRPKICTMGTMLSQMEKDSMGDVQIVTALKSIKDFHRNPNSHPGAFIDSADEAFSLVGALRAVMEYMLAKLPEPMPTAPIAIPTVSAPPLLSTTSPAQETDKAD